MNLPRNASISARAIKSEWKFEWSGFDGDDCFNEFNIVVLNFGNESRFEFGPAVVRSLRNLNRFFNEDDGKGVSGGFRCPDIRTYDLERKGEDFLLVLSTDNGKKKHEFSISNPEISCNTSFLKEYDGHDD